MPRSKQPSVGQHSDWSQAANSAAHDPSLEPSGSSTSGVDKVASSRVYKNLERYMKNFQEVWTKQTLKGGVDFAKTS